ncbi:fumarate hydratase [Porcipelethomonas ammoniilytica]|uniref:fumarate hydratase n=1 Tax=Porcipelethomonas ammoniilytica TaxID=2981722 RepID=UPI0008218ADA|nr:fumarate hydratase [Porcipelethomonas ammoniilytica]MCU6719920.1 fumarate hydratase [Porcipelethomonas ammoniilytica]SCI96968.1 L(+)-tartrate dehydratase subunit alpha [uncultured Ruminococcus sp.]
MREINVSEIENTIRDLCISANIQLPKSLEDKIQSCAELEISPAGKAVFEDLKANINAAKAENIPICQDTGMAVIFMEIGQDVHFTGGSLEDAINKGVSRGYTEGYLRCSIVGDPLERVNTGDNTPPVVHTRIVSGDTVKIDVCPKGFGSENMSALKMFTPSASLEDIVGFVIETASKAGSNPCPPMVIGVGIGGNFEHCAYLAKKALCRDTAVRNPKKLYKDLEDKMLEQINKLGIGPQGFGGKITALCVNIEQAPTHIAGLPVAVNIGCHVTRHASALI